MSPTGSQGGVATPVNGQKNMRLSWRDGSGNGRSPSSPTISLTERSPVQTQFPLPEVDYESNPAAMAQEMVNLQALRRMSMVDNAPSDPDLPSSHLSPPPNATYTVPESSSDGEVVEVSRLYWVPARLHPELAPQEFKTFLESRVNQIKRRSGDDSLLSPDGPQRQGSGGGLRRKKSMLSRQIDNSGGRGAIGYQDGAERLERKKSQSGQLEPMLKMADLHKMEALAQNSSISMRKLESDTTSGAAGGAGEVGAGNDILILPSAPPGHALRRSTRTTYRRGSLRNGERVPLSKRAAKVAETDSEAPSSLPSEHQDDAPAIGILRVQTEPISRAQESAENFSRPSVRARAVDQASGQADSMGNGYTRHTPPNSPSSPIKSPAAFAQRVPGEGSGASRIRRNSASSAPSSPVVPRIIETPPPEEDGHRSPVLPPQTHIPERRSSHEPPSSLSPQGPLPQGPPGMGRPPKMPGLIRHAQNAPHANQTLNDIVGQPSPLPGNSTRTDSLSFIPTYTEEKKIEKKGKDKKDKDGTEGGGVIRKSSWGWLLGSEEKEKEKEKEISKKAKSKTTRTSSDKPHDSTRLDLLQTSIDGNRGRESLVLDREEVRLEDERRKESGRKSSEPKREKESGLFSSLFGGNKKKGERDHVGKKDRSGRGLSPDPPYRVMRPDIDYPWTSFPLYQERAIYRMAHMKLANPRRALHSQVLLSNFMYGYLAKVQQMHPQIQMPQIPPQRQQQMQQEQQRHQQQQQQQQQRMQLEVDHQLHHSENQYRQYHQVNN